MKKFMISCLLILSLRGFSQTSETAIRNIVRQQETYWNQNNIAGYTGFFSDDCVLINFLGLYWKGRKQIESEFNKINECCIKPTEVKLEVLDIKFTSSASAVTHIKETLTAKADYTVPGGVVNKGTVNHKFITAVLEKKQGIWKIFAMQVTQVVPFPGPAR